MAYKEVRVLPAPMKAFIPNEQPRKKIGYQDLVGKRVHWARFIVPQIMTFMTGKKRYLPEINWEGNITHKIFRTYELIFWRKEGLRPESMTTKAPDENGVYRETRHFFTAEAFISHTESLARAQVKRLIQKGRIIDRELMVFFTSLFASKFEYVMVGMGPLGYDTKNSPYRFAIAFGNAATGTEVNTSSDSYSLTTSGSDRIAVFGGYIRGTSNFATGLTYNSASATEIGSQSNPGGTYDDKPYMFYKIAPTTGSNTVATTYTTGGYHVGCGASYSGAKQSGQPDNNGANSGSTTSLTTSITPVADNCWTVLIAVNSNGQTASTGATLRSGSGANAILCDSNGAIHPAASYSMTTTQSASQPEIHKIASIAPLASTTYNQTVTATTVLTSLMTKGLSKSVVATTAISGVVRKGLSKTIIATTAVTANILKQMSKTLIATTVVTASMVATKVYLQTIAATIALTASITKIPGKLLSATTVVSASVTKTASLVRTLVATTAVSASMIKALAKTLIATTAVTASITKTPNKLLKAITSVSASVSRGIVKVLVATTQVSASIIAGRAVIMVATVTTTATIGKTVGKLLKVTLSIIAKIRAPFYKLKYPPHGDGEDYEIKYPHE